MATSHKFEFIHYIDGVRQTHMVKRIQVDEDIQVRYAKADDGNNTTFTTLPIGELDEVQFLYLTPSAQMTLRLDGQSDAGITINSGGLIVLFDVDIDAGSSTNATINNNSGAEADVKGFVAGT
jgi:hypothetical protein